METNKGTMMLPAESQALQRVTQCKRESLRKILSGQYKGRRHGYRSQRNHRTCHWRTHGGSRQRIQHGGGTVVLKLTTLKTDSLRQEEKQAKEAMQTHKEPVMLIFLGELPGQWAATPQKTLEIASCTYTMLRYMSTWNSNICTNVLTPLTTRGTQAFFVVNSVKLHLTAQNYL